MNIEQVLGWSAFVSKKAWTYNEIYEKIKQKKERKRLWLQTVTDRWSKYVLIKCWMLTSLFNNNPIKSLKIVGTMYGIRNRSDWKIRSKIRWGPVQNFYYPAPKWSIAADHEFLSRNFPSLTSVKRKKKIGLCVLVWLQAICRAIH